jgi:hypothetical protein
MMMHANRQIDECNGMDDSSWMDADMGHGMDMTLNDENH